MNLQFLMTTSHIGGSIDDFEVDLVPNGLNRQLSKIGTLRYFAKYVSIGKTIGRDRDIQTFELSQVINYDMKCKVSIIRTINLGYIIL